METSVRHLEPVRPLPVVAGHLALDFVDTVDDPWGAAHFDHIGDTRRLVAWARLVDLLTEQQADQALADVHAHPARAAALLDRAHALRGTLESLFGAVVDREEIPTEAWRSLSGSVADAVGHASLAVDDGHATLGWGGELEDVLRRVAYAAHELLVGDQLHRVKRCAGCPWLYLDQSKNASRRWCAMDDCGKHEKMKRYVERRAARRRSVS